MTHFQILFTWQYYTSKYHGDTDFAATIELAIKIAKGGQKANFDQFSVWEFVQTRQDIRRSHLLLTEADLERLAGVTYLQTNC